MSWTTNKFLSHLAALASIVERAGRNSGDKLILRIGVATRAASRSENFCLRVFSKNLNVRRSRRASE